MLRLGELKNAKGATHDRKRLGRGSGSGQGQTAGKGSKGQLQRTGGRVKVGFEGGQMPLYRRIPKKGFTNIFRREFAIINLADLSEISLPEITLESLKKIRKVRGSSKLLKVLGTGEIKKSIKVKAHAVSESAKQKIEKAGGTVELIEA